jgi:sugar phosphate permease
VRASDAGIASGLIGTNQQVGGAIGVAAASTIAATYTNHYLDAHPGTNPASGAALTHGFEIAFYVLAALAALAAVAAALLIESKPALAEEPPVEAEESAAEAA